jgi:dihydrofolate reductase
MTDRPAAIVLVAARARTGVIGDRGRIPWHLPGDFAHFKALTLGHPLLLGRTTFESIGRVLPGRPHIVLTRDAAWTHDGVTVAHSVEQALQVAADLDPEVVHVAGGAVIYEAMLPLATAQVITEVGIDVDGDVRYPAFDEDEWRETRRDEHDGDRDNDPPWTVRWLERR